MSTRGCYRFSDGSNYGPFTVYKHSDNYPDGPHGGIAAITKALGYAWQLPRFEADEFAAAFVAANKESADDYARQYGEQSRPHAGGNVRLLNTLEANTLDHMPGDIEYLYDVTCRDGKLHITVQEIGHPNGWGSDELSATPIASGTLAQMQAKFKTRRKAAA